MGILNSIFKKKSHQSSMPAEIQEGSSLRKNDAFVYKNGDKYIGECIGRNPDGWGTYHYISNNSKYEGEFRDGKRHGVGTYYYDDGSRYTGEYRDDIKHGKGIYYNADGTIHHEGQWAEGQPVVSDEMSQAEQ